MELYQQEFGQHFNLGFDLSKYPWLVDKSWHNDVSPSFYFKTQTGYMVLWVDYEDSNQREDSSLERYVVMTAVNSGTDGSPEIHHDEESSVIFSSNMTEDCLTFLSTIIKAKATST
ncbi:hypothetical protein L2735_11630 [Shewanella olleyana]|uniref:hypothetical protein n=1 Tax=Shewanella olleyana TaxID=135626 RepID=UPI00200C6A7C|nr:hypothetical protein [Shewanella olleyana]MCL1067452.1 hypothetical protein [Shewanella olleyana]